MIVEGMLKIFLCGIFGGFLGELLKWYRIRTNEKLPHYSKSPFYWLITILIIISGGVITILYGVDKMNAMMAVNIGLSAPLLIQNISKSVIPHKPRADTENHGIRESRSGIKKYLSKNSLRQFLSE